MSLKILTATLLCLFFTFQAKASEIYLGPALLKPKCPFWGVELQRKAPLYKCIYTQTGVLLIETKNVYLFAGIGSLHPIGPRLDVYFSFSPGLYFHKEILNLGFPIEFRSCFELAFSFTPRLKLAAQFFHLSNAHLGKKNPGVNGSVLSLGFRM